MKEIRFFLFILTFVLLSSSVSAQGWAAPAGLIDSAQEYLELSGERSAGFLVTEVYGKLREETYYIRIYSVGFTAAGTVNATVVDAKPFSSNTIKASVVRCLFESIEYQNRNLRNCPFPPEVQEEMLLKAHKMLQQERQKSRQDE